MVRDQVRTFISKVLYDEIIYAYDNLKQKNKKTIGRKKQRVTILRASEELGKYLHKKRLKIKTIKEK